MGHQPMSYDDGSLWIVYNGEIYNHIELRKELVEMGMKFVSNSDTEVILAAYKVWGKECVSRFNGMWAFVLLDTKKQEVFISRDRFGVKPLYYWRSPDGHLAFASEIKAFTALPGWRSLLNEGKAYDFLVRNISDHSSETMFKNVHQIPGGCRTVLDLEDPSLGMTVERYYDLPESRSDCSKEEAAKGFFDRMQESVALRLRSDVVVGSCLSGGLDSSSIVVLASEIMKRDGSGGPIQTFTNCSTIEKFDEHDFAMMVAESAGASPHLTYPTAKDLVESLMDAIWYQDEPFSTTSIFAQWSVFHLAHSHGLKVMLDGQGADEYLAGYEVFFFPLLKKKLESNPVQFCQEMVSLWSEQGRSPYSFMKPVVKAWMRKSSNKDGMDEMVSDRIVEAKGDLPFPADLGWTKDISRFSRGQLMYTNLPKLLHWEDRNSMACSIESRVPFLDYRLVEYTLSLPDELKIDRSVTKIVLREAMKGHLPEKVRLRKDKMAFVTPEEHWFNGEGQMLRGLIESSLEHLEDVASPKLRQKIARMQGGTDEYEPWVWRFIIFGLWMKRYDVRIDSSRAN